ncbi:MAG: hypothetical protein H0V07_08905 [Propionibacteriales bacterium]|nr:hypothetical protein [Propionibacteriales bacterium]
MPILRLVMLGLCGALIAGCDGASVPSTGATGSGITTTPSTVAANGTTRPGTVVPLGQRVLVRWRADRVHDSRVALTVTSLTRGTIKDLEQFPLNDVARSSTVYYVSVTVRNTGTGTLTGQLLTLYGKVSQNLVVRPVDFTFPVFERCRNQPLPRFPTGAKARRCMVMLAPHHGRLTAVQWRGLPTAEPISWRAS